MWMQHSRDEVLTELQNTLKLLQSRDAETMKELASATSSGLVGLSLEDRRTAAMQSLKDSIQAVEKEPDAEGHVYHSRDPLTGIIQSNMGEDTVLPELQATGQGNPIVWIPAGIKGILEHFKAKYPFQTATAKSRVQIPDKCKIALLSDWGAPNIHAQRLGELAIGKGAHYVIHLGDIYYSGTESECKTFLDRWPLRGADAAPMKSKSFALNGNHEMYSLGKPFFTMVLPAFGQEASYFTLFNTDWQFQGIDTAYQPFSISGGKDDTRLQVQQQWLEASIAGNKDKKNIFLTHNQPVSAHLPEFEAAQHLMDEVRLLQQELGGDVIYGWFFGHEHRCAIYDDKFPFASFRARMIGNGSIAHHPQEETNSEKDETGTATTRFKLVNSRSLDEDKEVAISTFAMLTLDGPNIHVEYIDEDDKLFYAEDWNVNTKLAEQT